MNDIQEIYEETEIFFKSCSKQVDIFHRFNKMYNPLAFDTETTGLDFGVPSYFYVNETCQIEVVNPTAFGISVCLLYKGRFKLFWGRAGTQLFDDLVQLLQRKDRKIAHNARYDIRILRGQNVNILGPFDCTLTMSRIINDNRMKHSLQSLVETICPEMSDWEIDVKAEMKKIRARYTRMGHKPGYANYSFIPEKIMRKYACIDVFMTYILYLKYNSIIQRIHKEVYSREIKIMMEAINVENRGILFNRSRAKKETKALNKKSTVLVKSVQQYLGPDISPESYKQLLRGMLRYGFKQHELQYKGKASTRKEVLKRIERASNNKKHKKISTLLLNLRSARTLASRYLIPLTKRASYNHGIVYCSINSADTKTGRMSISKPSLQNIPRPDSGAEDSNAVRACFGPRAGYTWYLFDFSQIEVVYFCLLAGASHIVKAYMKGADIHAEMCRQVYDKVTKKLRQRTKAVSFGIMYGMLLKGLAEQQRISHSRAGQIMNMYLNRIPEITDFRDECVDLVRMQGYVDCLFGKRYTAGMAEAYKMVNKRIQGGCAQILKISMLQVVEQIRTRKHFHEGLVLPIHDELIFERRNDAYYPEEVFIQVVRKAMEEIPQLMDLGLKLRVDVSKTTTNWAEKEKVICR